MIYIRALTWAGVVVGRRHRSGGDEVTPFSAGKNPVHGSRINVAQMENFEKQKTTVNMRRIVTSD